MSGKAKRSNSKKISKRRVICGPSSSKKKKDYRNIRNRNQRPNHPSQRFHAQPNSQQQQQQQIPFNRAFMPPANFFHGNLNMPNCGNCGKMRMGSFFNPYFNGLTPNILVNYPLNFYSPFSQFPGNTGNMNTGSMNPTSSSEKEKTDKKSMSSSGANKERESLRDKFDIQGKSEYDNKDQSKCANKSVIPESCRTCGKRKRKNSPSKDTEDKKPVNSVKSKLKEKFSKCCDYLMIPKNETIPNKETNRSTKISSASKINRSQDSTQDDITESLNTSRITIGNRKDTKKRDDSRSDSCSYSRKDDSSRKSVRKSRKTKSIRGRRSDNSFKNSRESEIIRKRSVGDLFKDEKDGEFKDGKNRESVLNELKEENYRNDDMKTFILDLEKLSDMDRILHDSVVNVLDCDEHCGTLICQTGHGVDSFLNLIDCHFPDEALTGNRAIPPCAIICGTNNPIEFHRHTTKKVPSSPFTQELCPPEFMGDLDDCVCCGELILPPCLEHY